MTKKVEITGVWHFAIPTRDVQRAREFYEGVLGLRIMPISERKQRKLKPAVKFKKNESDWYAVGNVEFHVVVPAESLDTDVPGRLNPTRETHLAFEVADMDGAREALDEAGVTYMDITHMPGNPNQAKQIFFRDPDGNLVEIAQQDVAGELMNYSVEEWHQLAKGATKPSSSP